QNARAALAIAGRGYLLENGRIVGAGTAADLRDDPAVRRAYLGGAREDGNGAAGGHGSGRRLANGHAGPVTGSAAGPALLRPSIREEKRASTASNETFPGSETMIAVDLMIDNADVKAAGNATFERLNPMTGEVAARAAASSADDAVRAADAAA